VGILRSLGVRGAEEGEGHVFFVLGWFLRSGDGVWGVRVLDGGC
jgi:hypothetical protein